MIIIIINKNKSTLTLIKSLKLHGKPFVLYNHGLFDFYNESS